MAHSFTQAMLLFVYICVLEVIKMKLGEVVSDEHMDQPVPIEDKVPETMSVTECDDNVQRGDDQWEEDELDLIVFRCRD